MIDRVPKLAVSAPPSAPGYDYLYPANSFLSIAIANVYDDAAIVVPMIVRDSRGNVVATDLIHLPPEGHLAFTLYDKFPSLGTAFEGSLRLAPTDQLYEYVSWAMAADSSGVISSLPSGRFAAPKSQWDEIWRVFQTLLVFATPIIGPDAVDLSISFIPAVNAFASNGKTVGVTMGLAELVADSPSELAFAVGHELGHIYQQRTGRMDFRPDNAESDADLWGVLFGLSAGYDPYGAAGTLAKLAMATGSASLTTQFFEDLRTDEAHRSFSTRINEIFETVRIACANPELKETCQTYKSLVHPNLPDTSPLLEVLRASTKRGRPH